MMSDAPISPACQFEVFFPSPLFVRSQHGHGAYHPSEVQHHVGHHGGGDGGDGQAGVGYMPANEVTIVRRKPAFGGAWLHVKMSTKGSCG